MYNFWRSLLFTIDPERAHALALGMLRIAPQSWFPAPVAKPFIAMNLEFPHPLGLAAGLDKNGDYLDALAKIGFAFIELGTVTPKPQDGNPKPRLFRLPEAEAIINRMGFNNRGVDYLVRQVRKANYKGILGINIGKNKDTPLDRAADDYLYCLRKVFPYASYITVNISSPNTPDLRLLQQADYFGKLLDRIREEQLRLCDLNQKYVPLVIKLSPDETEENLKRMAEVMLRQGIEGAMISNTTNHREAVAGLVHSEEAGGLSGRPLFDRSTRSLALMSELVGNDMTLIGVGGVNSAATAQEKINAGAELVQIYTGLIYEGPEVMAEIVAGLKINEGSVLIE